MGFLQRQTLIVGVASKLSIASVQQPCTVKAPNWHYLPERKAKGRVEGCC
jgi:hypothetical protein